jgi:heme exporter protein D
MAKSGRTFTTIFLLSGLFLAIGVGLGINESADDPLGKSSLGLIIAATSIGFGLAMLYMAIKSFLHHRAIMAHISRRRRRAKPFLGVRKGKTHQEGDD